MLPVLQAACIAMNLRKQLIPAYVVLRIIVVQEVLRSTSTFLFFFPSR